MKGEMVPGSVHNGGGLLVGLLRCGHCGRKLEVQHNGQGIYTEREIWEITKDEGNVSRERFSRH